MQTTEELIDASAAPAQVATRPKPWTILASDPFRKLWGAATLSWLGTFFSYVATAWLVLQLTGSSLALGSVLVIEALPRAVLLVVGGALSDRFSARLTMLASMAVRAAVVALLAVLVLTKHVQMWEVYGVAAVFGVFDAFFMPARTSILPAVVADHELEPANSLLNITGSATVVVGPVVAGLVVTTFGTGWAFVGDAACFVLGFLLVAALRAAPPSAADAARKKGGLGGQIVDGLRFAWSDTGLRVTLIVIAVIDFGANGAIGVGLPTLAHGRYGAGATGYGVLLGAWGVGATLGALGSGIVPPPKRFGWMIVLLCVWLGAGLMIVGLVPSLILAALTMGLSGVGTGVVNTYGISWLQRRTAANMQGRVMSLVMLASTGLTPISFAASGAIAQLNPTLLFVIAAGMILLCAVGTAASRSVRELR